MKSNSRLQRRMELLIHYGGNPPKCKRCGFSDIRALSIDHINGGGSAQKRALKVNEIGAWIRKNNYPEGFQILCMNCNWIKRAENDETSSRSNRKAVKVFPKSQLELTLAQHLQNVEGI